MAIVDRVRPCVSEEPCYYLDPEEHPPPIGQKMYLLTRFGTAIVGTWSTDGSVIGWRPLYRMTPKQKAIIRGNYAIL